MTTITAGHTGPRPQRGQGWRKGGNHLKKKGFYRAKFSGQRIAEESAEPDPAFELAAKQIERKNRALKKTGNPPK
jgi:hypothetical protein